MTDPDLTVASVIDDDLREWILAELRYPVLAVVSPTGIPSQSVMWFGFDEERPDTIVMNTKLGRAKARWVGDGDPLSVLFEDGYIWCAFQGRAVLDDDPDRAMADIQRLARRYGSDPERFVGQERVTIRIQVEKVIRHA